MPSAASLRLQTIVCLLLAGAVGAAEAAEAAGADAGAARAGPPAHAADAAALAISVDAIRATRDFRAEPWSSDGKAAQQEQRRDPFGYWHSGLCVLLEVAGLGGVHVLAADQLTGSASLDTLETIAIDPAPSRITDASGTMVGFGFPCARNPLPPTSLTLSLLSPTKPARLITSLSGTLRLVLGDDAHVHAVHATLVPGGKPLGFPDIPGCDLRLQLLNDGTVKSDYGTQGLRRIQDLRVLGADGHELAMRGSSSSCTGTSCSITATYSAQPVAIDLSVFDGVHAVTITFQVAGLPLAGDAGPAPPACSISSCVPAGLPPSFLAANEATVPASAGDAPPAAPKPKSEF